MHDVFPVPCKSVARNRAPATTMLMMFIVWLPRSSQVSASNRAAATAARSPCLLPPQRRAALRCDSHFHLRQNTLSIVLIPTTVSSAHFWVSIRALAKAAVCMLQSWSSLGNLICVLCSVPACVAARGSFTIRGV